MKTIIYISMISLAGVLAVNAQSDNYKMPYNKASRPTKKVKLEYTAPAAPQDNFEASANYKAGFNTKSNSGAIVPVMPFDIVVAPLDNPSNYKAMNAGKKQKDAPAKTAPSEDNHNVVVKN